MFGNLDSRIQMLVRIRIDWNEFLGRFGETFYV